MPNKCSSENLAKREEVIKGNKDKAFVFVDESLEEEMKDQVCTKQMKI
jgi:hypothetical protein